MDKALRARQEHMGAAGNKYADVIVWGLDINISYEQNRSLKYI